MLDTAPCVLALPRLVDARMVPRELFELISSTTAMITTIQQAVCFERCDDDEYCTLVKGELVFFGVSCGATLDDPRPTPDAPRRARAFSMVRMLRLAERARRIRLSPTRGGRSAS